MSENPDVLLAQARRMQEAGQTDKAREAVVAALKLDRANADAWHMAAMFTEDEREKCEAMRRALGLAPDNTEFRQIYNALACDEKISKSIPPARRAELSKQSDSSSSMVMALLFALLGIVVLGAGAAFLVSGDESDSAGQPSDAEVANIIQTRLVEMGGESPIDPSAIAEITVVNADLCDVSPEDAAEGITDKWIYAVEITYLEGTNPFWSDRVLPPSWPIYARDGRWFTERRVGSCIVQ